jgi:hypothetical protein
MSATTQDWQEANQRYLSAALAVLRQSLERRLAGDEAETAPPEAERSARQALCDAAAAMPAPAALETVSGAFRLSPFERELLLLCAGVELDSSFGALCAMAHGDPGRAYPTFSLALAALPDPHWSALTPAAPLRHWRLIEIGAGSALTQSPLRIDERVLHYLAGVSHLDERLQAFLEPIADAAELTPSQRRVAERIVAVWSRAAGEALPLIQLCGDDTAGQHAVAAAAAGALGLRLLRLRAGTLPTAPGELEALIRLLEREAVLGGSALLVEAEAGEATDAGRSLASTHLLEHTRGALFVATRERRPLRDRPTVAFDLPRPGRLEQRAAWQSALAGAAMGLNGQVEALVSQFSLSPSVIRAISLQALGGAEEDLGAVLWDACRSQARPRLDDLAQRIEPAATWEELVLPEAQRQTLQEIAAHVRQRARVYETWGFAGRGSRGLGISALFAGASGTGKTLAAEVLAHALRLDLYRIDLSQVVSKYIGETEKNLRRVFDAAEEAGAVLLFDEADALFGKRSEVKDSHDRYANIEVSYLLQRMEAYRGLAILTTNQKSALDPAFLRRLRFVVEFPFPDSAQRAEIWRRIFPDATPTEGLDAGRLARLNVAGGNIRNIALHAAFLAADAGEPVRMTHLLRAAHREYAKLERPLTDAETGGWR